MDVSDQLHGLDGYFQSSNKDGMPMEEIYRRVQETVIFFLHRPYSRRGRSFDIQSKEAAKHILKDLVMAKGGNIRCELSFLRNFINTQIRNLLPDAENEFSEKRNSCSILIDFTLQNFTQMNKLWVRMQSIRQRRGYRETVDGEAKDQSQEGAREKLNEGS